MVPISIRRQLCVHGSAVNVELAVDKLDAEFDHFLRPFDVTYWPVGFNPICGMISRFDLDEISRNIPASAVNVSDFGPFIKLYHLGERHWIVDERWGMAEINLMKSHWRSWLLPHPTLNPVECFESAVLWPMAQLLKPRGLELLPAVSVEKNGWGALIISPYGIVPEISKLLGADYRVVGQRWTALRAEEDFISLLSLPGVVEKRSRPKVDLLGLHRPLWFDVLKDLPWSSANHAACKMVLIIDPARRAVTSGRDVPESSAAALLRHAWPIVRLPVSRRLNSLPAMLASQCPCVQVQLSRNEDDFVKLIESLRRQPPRPTAPNVQAIENSKLQLSISLDSWKSQRLSA